MRKCDNFSVLWNKSGDKQIIWQLVDARILCHFAFALDYTAGAFGRSWFCKSCEDDAWNFCRLCWMNMYPQKHHCPRSAPAIISVCYPISSESQFFSRKSFYYKTSFLNPSFMYWSFLVSVHTLFKFISIKKGIFWNIHAKKKSFPLNPEFFIDPHGNPEAMNFYYNRPSSLSREVDLTIPSWDEGAFFRTINRVLTLTNDKVSTKQSLGINF